MAYTTEIDFPAVMEAGEFRIKVLDKLVYTERLSSLACSQLPSPCVIKEVSEAEQESSWESFSYMDNNPTCGTYLRPSLSSKADF